MTFKRLFVSLFAALALLASIVCVMFFGAPKTTASAAADDARAVNKRTFVLKHGDSDGFYPVTSGKWYKFKVSSTPGSVALYSGDTQIGTWTYDAPPYIKDSLGNKQGTWVAPESNGDVYFKITGKNYKLKVPESDKYIDYFYEEVTDTTIPDVKEVEKLSFELIPAPQEGYTVKTNKWYKFEGGANLTNIQLKKDNEQIGYTLDVPHSGFKKDGVFVGGIYLYGGTEAAVYFVKFDDAYQLVISTDSYIVNSNGSTGAIYEEAGKEEPENPGESGSTENPGESDKSGSSERFVDAASKWLKDNLAVNVSAGVVGGIIVIGLIVLVFKRK